MHLISNLNTSSVESWLFIVRPKVYHVRTSPGLRMVSNYTLTLSSK